jgi:hypothetical protein
VCALIACIDRADPWPAIDRADWCVPCACAQLVVSKEQIPSWPQEKLTVLAEHSSIFYDLMTSSMLEQVTALRRARVIPRQSRWVGLSVFGGSDAQLFLGRLPTAPRGGGV